MTPVLFRFVFIIHVCYSGDITQKGYEKKRLKLLTPFLEDSRTSGSAPTVDAEGPKDQQPSNISRESPASSPQKSTPKEVDKVEQAIEVVNPTNIEKSNDADKVKSGEGVNGEEKPRQPAVPPHKSGKPRSRHRRKR